MQTEICDDSTDGAVLTPSLKMHSFTDFSTSENLICQDSPWPSVMMLILVWMDTGGCTKKKFSQKVWGLTTTPDARTNLLLIRTLSEAWYRLWVSFRDQSMDCATCNDQTDA